MSYLSNVRAKIGNDPIILVGVCGFIASGDKILLQKRSDNMMWGLPGGLMELNETAEGTLRREIDEELGLATEALAFFGLYTNRPIIMYPNGDQSQPVGIFFTVKTSGIPRAKAESLAVKFFGKDELPEQIFSIHREPIMDYFEGSRNVIK